MQYSLAELSQTVGGTVFGDEKLIIRGLGDLKSARPGELVFIQNPNDLSLASGSSAAAFIVPDQVSPSAGLSGIKVSNPRLAFVRLLHVFSPEPITEAHIHPTAVIAESAEIGEDVAIGPYSVVGERSRIGKGCRIGGHVLIGDDVSIGDQCLFYGSSMIYSRCTLGNRVILHGGVIIGADGFGFIFHEGQHHKVPQIGEVRIEDDVEIGANSCVDRATIGVTVIGQGTKIDNQVQVAHNNIIGKHVILCGQVGLAGSVQIDDYSMLGGQAGVIDHLHLGAQSKVGASGLVTKDIPAKGEWWGTPARDGKAFLKQMAALAQLPKILKQFKALARRIDRMEQSGKE